MMIGPEAYYEERLNGKGIAEIEKEIRRLRREISRLKKVIEHPEYVSTVRPSEDTVIWCDRLYLERAKHALEDAGGTYVSTEAEKRADKFQANISDICKLELTIWCFDCKIKARSYTVCDEEIRFDVTDPFDVFDPELYDEDMDREGLFDAVANLHIGEWRRRYDPSRFGYEVLDGESWQLCIYYSDGKRKIEISGDNSYPYNFGDLLQLFCIE